MLVVAGCCWLLLVVVGVDVVVLLGVASQSEAD